VVGVPPRRHAAEVLVAVLFPDDPHPNGNAGLATLELGRLGRQMHVQHLAPSEHVGGRSTRTSLPREVSARIVRFRIGGNFSDPPSMSGIAM
jgi:hypothetical protein